MYGTVSKDHANVHINLNGQKTTISMNVGPSNARSLHSRTLWVSLDLLVGHFASVMNGYQYFADGLGPGQHSLSVTSDVQQQTSPFVDVDAFVVYSLTGVNSTERTNSTG